MKLFKNSPIKWTGKTLFILSNKEIKKGDFVLAVDGYPHWYDFPQECTLVFSDNLTIGLRSCIRVDKSCFRKIRMTIKLFSSN